MRKERGKMETVEVFKQQQAKTVEVLERLLTFLHDGGQFKQFGVEIDQTLIKKVEQGIQQTSNEKLKIALIGGFSEGKTSIAAAWSEHYDTLTMKISQSESTDELAVYSLGDFDLIDTPGLFGFKETADKQKYKDITKKYISEAHLILYVMNPSNPIKESHKEILVWLFKDLDLLSRTVFIVSRFDEEVDIEDDENYERALKVKQENIVDRLRDFGIIESNDEVPIVAVSANPWAKGIAYWLSHLAEFKKLSHIDTLQKATADKIKSAGNTASLVLASQKSIVRDILLREMPVARERAAKAVEECRQFDLLYDDMQRELAKVKQTISGSRITLRDFVVELFTDLILQTEGTSLDTFNEFFQQNIGNEGVVLNTKIQNEFERELGIALQEIDKIEMSFNAGVEHYNSIVGDMALNGLKMGAQFLKNGGARFTNTGILAVRDMLRLSIKFKPWEAIKLAKVLNKYVPIIGSVIGIGFELWDSYSQKKKEEEFQRGIGKMVSNFDQQRQEYLDLIDDDQRFVHKAFPRYIELVEQLAEAKEEMIKKEQRQAQFAKWQKDAEVIEADFKIIG
jgi:predicted GTPase/uncharacterized membrane-anchored protein YhcB (DUF1043 family)